MTKVELISKLTLKTMNAQPKAHSIKENTKLAVIYGRARDVKHGTSDYGTYARFLGEFEGVNGFTGEVYRSGELIVPTILESLLAGAIGGEGAEAVEFAVEIWAKPSDKGSTGYEYGVKPLVEVASSDELANLRQLANEASPIAIAAPAPKGKAKAAAVEVADAE